MTSLKNSVSGLLIALSCLLMAGSVSGQGRLSIEEVKDGLHVITGPGGNIGVRLTADGVILIDDKFPEDFEEIQSLVASVTALPVKYVINTHHHGDHSGSNASFLQTAEVIAHKNARDNIIRNNQDGAPRIIFMDETAVFLGGVEVQAFHLGTGHTNGDAVVYFPDLNTIH
ncbi:MAG: MBL fold metallo-hydrolase, partial [Proteobacteria bacterium]|nr:MBL fold metallo-hydrolase [Pseudomonadota bacterium]